MGGTGWGLGGKWGVDVGWRIPLGILVTFQLVPRIPG